MPHRTCHRPVASTTRDTQRCWLVGDLPANPQTPAMPRTAVTGAKTEVRDTCSELLSHKERRHMILFSHPDYRLISLQLPFFK